MAAIVTAKSIHALFKCGKSRLACKLFDEMPDKNVITYSSIIYGCSTHGLFAESLAYFSQLQKTKIHPNSFTFVALLLTAVGMRDTVLGESVHGRTIKSGFESNSFVKTSLVNFYAKCGNVIEAYSLFRGMAEWTLITCNSMVSGFVHNCLFKEALFLFKQLRTVGLAPNCLTIMSISQGCIGYDSFRLCESIHCYVVKLGLDSDVSVTNSVFNMYSSLGDLDSAKDFFGKMVVLDVVSWTSMMGVLLEAERANEALGMFVRMRASGVVPDMITIMNVTTACGLLGDLKRGRSVHSQIMTRGIGLELSVINTLITMYSKCQDPESAEKLFDHMVDKSLVSYTAMISGFMHNGQHSQGLGLLIKMRREENYTLDSVTLVSLLTSLSELVNFELCKQLHAYSFKLGLDQNTQVQNCLLSTYGNCGHVDLALRVFKEIICKDTVSWNAMISSYGINGKGEEAISLFHDMEKCNEKPDSFTYVSVLNACSHSGLVDTGMAIFERMVGEKKIDLRGEHLGCVVDILARAGWLAEAREFVKSIEETGENVWKTLLAGCCTYGDFSIAEMAASGLSQMSSGDSDHVVMLSNMYSSVGRFQTAEALRLTELKCVVKTPGISVVDSVPC